MQSAEKKKETNKNKLQPMRLDPAGISFRIQEEKVYLLRQEKQKQLSMASLACDIYFKKKKKKRLQ